MAGLYFPIFFVQLKAVETGIEPTLAFYVVGYILSRRD